MAEQLLETYLKVHIDTNSKRPEASIKRRDLIELMRALKGECKNIVVACKVLRRRYNNALKRHQSFPEEVRTARWIEGRMDILEDYMGRFRLIKIMFIQQNFLVIGALRAEFEIRDTLNVSQLMLFKHCYEATREDLLNKLKGAHKLMERALGSWAA